MNQRELKQQLEALPKQERPAYLIAMGLPEHEVPDLLRYFFADRPTKAPKSGTDPVRWMMREARPKDGALTEALAKCEAMIQRKRQEPPVENTEGGLTQLERDVLHNRLLLGGETLLDEASFQNPDLRQTETIRWFLNSFIPSGSQFAVVMGGAGSGKTFGALAYINRIAKVEMGIGQKIQKTNAAYVHAYRLYEMISDRKKHGEKLDEITRNVGILLIDDLGTEPTGFRGGDFLAHFEYLIGERHKFRKKTIMTSNTTSEDFKELYGERIVSRFNEIGLFLETKDPDMRKEN